MGIGAEKCLALELAQIRTQPLLLGEEGERRVEEGFVHPDEVAVDRTGKFGHGIQRIQARI
jgi:hypothetical protein